MKLKFEVACPKKEFDFFLLKVFTSGLLKKRLCKTMPQSFETLWNCAVISCHACKFSLRITACEGDSISVSSHLTF